MGPKGKIDHCQGGNERLMCGNERLQLFNWR